MCRDWFLYVEFTDIVSVVCETFSYGDILKGCKHECYRLSKRCVTVIQGDCF